MAERFEDTRFLLIQAMIKKRAEDFKVTFPQYSMAVMAVELAQHAADMAHEIACPCDCHTDSLAKAVQGTTLAEAWLCPTCSNTGRVTLGALVAADRAKKATPERPRRQWTAEQRAKIMAQWTLEKRERARQAMMALDAPDRARKAAP